MPKYRPKNIEVEAMQFTRENAEEFKQWLATTKVLKGWWLYIERNMNYGEWLVIQDGFDFLTEKEFKNKFEPIPENAF